MGYCYCPMMGEGAVCCAAHYTAGLASVVAACGLNCGLYCRLDIAREVARCGASLHRCLVCCWAVV